MTVFDYKNDNFNLLRTQLDHIDKLSQELNEYQRVFKMPLTKFEVLTILKVEFENLEEIYRVIF